MEHSPYIIEDNAYSRASSFTDLRSAGDQQTFNIRPGNAGTDGCLENGLQSSTLVSLRTDDGGTADRWILKVFAYVTTDRSENGKRTKTMVPAVGVTMLRPPLVGSSPRRVLAHLITLFQER